MFLALVRKWGPWSTR